MKELLNLGEETLEIVCGGVQSFSLYLTLGLAALLIILLAVTYCVKKEYFENVKKFSFGVIVGYSVTLVAVAFYLQLSLASVKGKVNTNFYLFVGFFFLLIALIIAYIVLSVRFVKICKYFTLISILIIVVYGVILLAVIPTKKADYNPLNKTAFYVLSVLLTLAIIVLAYFFGEDRGTAPETKSLAYAGVCIALSFALSYVKFFSLPQSGSVTLASMLPLMLYAYVFGARKGVFAGVIYGVLQCVQNPSIYQPMQVLIDYPIAFSAIGLTGIAKKFKFLKGNMITEFTVGAIIAVIFRYAAHVLSGYFVFYTWAQYSVFNDYLVYSLVYNSFVFVDLAIDLAVGLIVLSSKQMRKRISEINPKPLEA